MKDKDIEYIVSKQQAQEIAKFIFADIEAYVNSHPNEYADFLKNEGVIGFRLTEMKQ